MQVCYVNDEKLFVSVSGGNRVRRRSVGLARNLTQYTIENTEGLLGDVMLHKVVLSQYCALFC